MLYVYLVLTCFQWWLLPPPNPPASVCLEQLGLKGEWHCRVKGHLIPAYPLLCRMFRLHYWPGTLYFSSELSNFNYYPTAFRELNVFLLIFHFLPAFFLSVSQGTAITRCLRSEWATQVWVNKFVRICSLCSSLEIWCVTPWWGLLGIRYKQILSARLEPFFQIYILLYNIIVNYYFKKWPMTLYGQNNIMHLPHERQWDVICTFIKLRYVH